MWGSIEHCPPQRAHHTQFDGASPLRCLGRIWAVFLLKNYINTSYSITQKVLSNGARCRQRSNFHLNLLLRFAKRRNFSIYLGTSYTI